MECYQRVSGRKRYDPICIFKKIQVELESLVMTELTGTRHDLPLKTTIKLKKKYSKKLSSGIE